MTQRLPLFWVSKYVILNQIRVIQYLVMSCLNLLAIVKLVIEFGLTW